MNTTIPKWQKYRLKDLEAYRKRKRDYARTPEQRKKRTEYMKAYRKRHAKPRVKKPKQDSRDFHYLKRYGITYAQKEQMVLDQGGKCLICQTPFTTKRHIHLDHCHKTNRLRGILCYSCNSKLGWFEKHGQKITEYLES